MMCERWHACDVIFQRLAQDLQDMAAALGPCVLEVHAMVGQQHGAPPISPTSEMVWWEGRNGWVATTAVRLPVRPARRWMQVVSKASARIIAGRMVVSRRAIIDVLAPGGPRKSGLWSERLHDLQLSVAIST
jgi:hypothetical protein